MGGVKQNKPIPEEKSSASAVDGNSPTSISAKFHILLHRRHIARKEPGFAADFRLGDDTHRKIIASATAFLGHLEVTATAAKFIAYSMPGRDSGFEKSRSLIAWTEARSQSHLDQTSLRAKGPRLIGKAL